MVQLWLLVASVAISRVIAKPLEEEKIEDWNVGLTLLVSLVSMMMLHYVTNAKDPDIRRYCNEIISCTIGIFCAVLCFQTVNELVENTNKKLFKDTSEERRVVFELLIRGVFVTVCYAVLQIVIAYCSNLFMPTANYDAWISTREGAYRTKLNLNTAGIFFAHVTAFATISMWAGLQQTAWFASCPSHAFVAVALAVLFGGSLYFGMRWLRYVIIHWDDSVEYRENQWSKNAIEAENDVTSIAVSFLLVQVFRFWVSGHLPDAEGNEKNSVYFHHSAREVSLLGSVGLVFAIASWLLLILGRRLELVEVEDEEEEGSFAEEAATGPRASVREAMVFRPQSLLAIRQFFGTLLSRGIETLVLLCSMTFSWCMYFGSKWMLGSMEIFTRVSCGFAISHAVCLSVGCFAFIWVCDKIDDYARPYKTTEDLSKGLAVMIRSIGILIGFAWEQSFDVAVVAVAEHNPHHKGLTKVALALGSVAIVAPAWRLFIVPMVLEGWRFGFVTNHVVSKAQEITNSGHESRAAEFVREYRKLLHRLQTIHHEEEPHIDVTAAVFDRGLALSRESRQCWSAALLPAGHLDPFNGSDRVVEIPTPLQEHPCVQP